MDTEKLAGGAAIAAGTLNGVSDQRFLENLDGLLHKKPVIEQVFDECFECFPHCRLCLRVGIGEVADTVLESVLPDAFHLAIVFAKAILQLARRDGSEQVRGIDHVRRQP